MKVSINVIPIKNERPDLCSPCGGQCCKRAPGIYHPSQIFKGETPTFKDLLDALSNKASITWVEFCRSGLSKEDYSNFETVPVILPRDVHSPDIVFRSSIWGKCVHLTDIGCSFQHQDRPLECQMLEARPDRECGLPKTFDRVKDLLEQWLPYRDFMERFDDMYSRRVIKQKG